jgi:hypothetical protein
MFPTLIFNIQVSLIGCDCRDISSLQLDNIINKLKSSRNLSVIFLSRIYIAPLECSDVFVVGKFDSYEDGYKYVNEIYNTFNKRVNTIAVPDYFMFPRYCSG